MIALDSSSLIAYLSGEAGDDVEVVEAALRAKRSVLPPVVLCEVLSEPRLPSEVASALLEIPLLVPTEGYWERAGRLRARVISRRRKAPLADVLIAQSCIDYDVSLVTRDRGFRPLAAVAGLRLA